MQKRYYTLLACAASLLMAAALPAQTTAAPATPVKAAAPAANKQQLRIGIVNFKQCVEKSKLGKQEQSNFENLKKQMESVLGEKDKTLNDLAAKLNDPDYLDSLSAEAETDLKRKFRALSQELSGQQQEYMQVLQQTNLKVIQNMNDLVTKAANGIAKSEGYDIILNEEGVFSSSPDLDITNKVVASLDADFEKEAASKTTANN